MAPGNSSKVWITRLSISLLGMTGAREGRVHPRVSKPNDRAGFLCYDESRGLRELALKDLLPKWV